MIRRDRSGRLLAASLAASLAVAGCSGSQVRGEAGLGGGAGQRRSSDVGEAAPRRDVAAETETMVAERQRRRADARVAACRAAHDLRPFEADVVGRYLLQGRMSDVAMTRWLDLLSARAGRLAAARSCIVQAEGAGAAIPQPERLLPVLHQATLGLLATVVSAASRWAQALDGAHDATSAAWLATLRADVTPLLPQDGPWAASVSATHRFEVLDVQVVQPAPIPIVDQRGRPLATETPLTVILRPLPWVGAIPGLCLHRFVTEVRPARGRRQLRVWPQWRVATCPAATPQP